MKGEFITIETAQIMADIKREINKLYKFVKWHYEDNKDFYKNKGIGLTCPETDYVLDTLKMLKENIK